MRRKYIRVPGTQPISISCEGQLSYECTPRDISIGGCFFDFDPPGDLEDSVRCVSLTLSEGEVLEIEEPEFFSRGSGFGFRWKLPREESAALNGHLGVAPAIPSMEVKARFLTKEVEIFANTIHQLETSKGSGFRFLFLLIGGYFALLTAPYEVFTIDSPEEAAFYSVAGIWASVLLIYHFNRYLSFLGKMIRRKVLLARGISGHRAWFFSNDNTYYANSVFPAGVRYDQRRMESHICKDSASRIDSSVEWIPYQKGTTFFFLFLESIFVLGLVHFLSLGLRAYIAATSGTDDLDVMSFAIAGKPNVFSADDFRRAFSISTGAIVLWIQFLGNTCAHYQRAIWEARRIEPGRPNPRFTGQALSRYHPVVCKIFRFGMYCIMAYSAVCFFGLIRPFYDADNFVSQTISSFGFNLAVVTFFLLGKIAYWGFQAMAETRSDKENLNTAAVNGNQ